MSTCLSDLEPKQLWSNFLKVSAVPRPSKKEEKITAFIKQFGENLGLATIVDSVGNVIIRKPATKGYDNLKCVTLQGHMDMVPQKTPDSNHNFETDPIELYVDGEWVTANQTTLGADNGIGVAAAMSILEAKDIKHGPIEALFTVDEESGMSGAFALTDKQLNGEILLNLDSGEFGTICIGCAGGINTDAHFSLEIQETPKNHVGFQLNVSGLKGGHSGAEIHLYRGNANKILVGLLNQCLSKINFNLNQIQGGNLSNVIPREADCLITVNNKQQEAFINIINSASKSLKTEFSLTDANLRIDLVKCKTPETVFKKPAADLFIKSLHACPSGLLSMFPLMPTVVATSTNLSIIKTHDNSIDVVTSQRSAIEPAKNQVSSMVQNIFELGGATCEQGSDYPGWSPIDDSDIIEIAKKVYQIQHQIIPETLIVHGGLECGLIKKEYPNMDMISFGPNISDAHSPDEKMFIPSVKLFWEYLVKILEYIPTK